jgi:hypothetical protein
LLDRHGNVEGHGARPGHRVPRGGERALACNRSWTVSIFSRSTPPPATLDLAAVADVKLVVGDLSEGGSLVPGRSTRRRSAAVGGGKGVGGAAGEPAAASLLLDPVGQTVFASTSDWREGVGLNDIRARLQVIAVNFSIRSGADRTEFRNIPRDRRSLAGRFISWIRVPIAPSSKTIFRSPIRVLHRRLRARLPEVATPRAKANRFAFLIEKDWEIMNEIAVVQTLCLYGRTNDLNIRSSRHGYPT